MSKYLIKIWSCGKADLIANLDWETNESEDVIKKEISLCFLKQNKGLRATIERKNGRENEKPRERPRRKTPTEYGKFTYLW